MGCGSNKNKLPPNGTIVPLTVKAAKPKIQSKRPKIRQQFDHHCDVCGYSGPHATHTCRGPKKIGYVETRRGWCSRCSYSEDGVCTLYKSLHPDRDCVIEVGIKMPFAACPAGLWTRVEYTCERCQSVTFLDSGVSRCKACGYVPKRIVNLPPKITVKPEEPWQPTKPLAVVTLAVGQKALELFELTGPQMAKYADRCGADFHAITDDQQSEYPLANKFRLQHLSINYERILFIDVDVWVRDAADNLFDFVPRGSVGIHRDYEYLSTTDWVAGEAASAAKQQQVEPIQMQVLNTGVVVFDAAHAEIWSPPKLPYKRSHLTEQTQVEYNLVRLGFAIHKLKLRHNTQWWMPVFKESEPNAHFIHLANCPHEERLYRLRKLAQATK